MVQISTAYEPPVIEVLGGVREFFDRILQRKLSVSANVDCRAWKIKEFIDNHPVQDHQNLDVVCKQLGLSMSGRQARRLFKVSTGVGIKDYAVHRRLSVAVEQLEGTDAPVKAIAADLGYRSTREFGRLFKQRLGISPLQFRRVSWSAILAEDKSGQDEGSQKFYRRN